MPRKLPVLALATVLGLGACSSAPEREWMKIGQSYTVEDFRHDVRECSRSGGLDEACMRQRGWVAVSTSRSEKPPEEPIPGRGY